MPALLLYSTLANEFAPKEGYYDLRAGYVIWFVGGCLATLYAFTAPLLALIIGDYVNTAPSPELNNLWFRATVLGSAMSLLGVVLLLTSR